MAHVYERSTAELASWIRTEVDFVGPITAGATGRVVRRVQEWLGLHGHGVVVDGDFGPATKRAVTAFQQGNGLDGSGVVDRRTYGLFVAPMLGVLGKRRPGPLGDVVVGYARTHLGPHPREVGGPNSGPWVRLYMSGQQGEAYAWCAGFVTFLLEQAAQTVRVDKPIAGSINCDVLYAQGRQAGVLVSETEAPAKLTPGSVFLVRRTAGDWTHTGIVTEVRNDTFDTIEGNTNDAGEREGYEVCARTRSYPGKDFLLV